ncbi:hypothetical protein XM38_027390 [Halomicronema hongdechloris C2206]|uniref:Chromosome partition protein Smc n=1 Tax=Halomicronema hongdechloris C2206 TaxID=1641165 RepID=A0A1Z3HND1_9CYAN|nr:hypothetical protein [Halomicronema hongdechloris]ASC71785.1 hypothetical protein XM38_027390 [Halomicronema hongdechloris C2206]
MSHDGSLDFKLVQRICLLQRALDQALDALDDLQQRVEEHQLLESQLVKTERYANVQQQIIVTLKQQLADKTSWQQQVLWNLVLGIATAVQQQQRQIQQLRRRLQQSQIEVQTYLGRLTNQCQDGQLESLAGDAAQSRSELMIVRSLTVTLGGQLQQAYGHVQQLEACLSQHRLRLLRLQVALEDGVPSAKAMAATEAEESAPPPSTPDALAADSQALEPCHQAETLFQALQITQQQLSDLETELAEQFQQQSQLKYRYQAVAAERDQYKQENDALRRENVALKARLQQLQGNQIMLRQVGDW